MESNITLLNFTFFSSLIHKRFFPKKNEKSVLKIAFFQKVTGRNKMTIFGMHQMFERNFLLCSELAQKEVFKTCKMVTSGQT